MTGFKTVREALRARGTSDFLLGEAEVAPTAEDVLSLAVSLTATLSQQGIKPGARVGFALRNGPQTAQIMLALMAAGYVAVAVNLQAVFC